METLFFTNFRGEIAALSAAFLWASASTIYAVLGNKIPALLLNLIKSVIALIFLVLTLLIAQTNLINIQANLLPILLLSVSGVIGIGIGDTAFFKSLNYLGARKTLLMETLAPPLTAILALIFLDEKLAFTAYLGILITLMGVSWVISERTEKVTDNIKQVKQGLRWALLGIICQSSGAITSRLAFSLVDIAPLWSTFIRLVGGTIIILILLVKNPVNQLKIVQSIYSFKLGLIIIVTAFCSTFLGIWLQQTAFKFAPVGVAQTLMATSPLFVIPIVICLGEKITIRAMIGVLIAVIGISLLFL